MQWFAPFGKENVKVVYETPQRITSVEYSEDCQWLFLTQAADNQRQIVAVNLNAPKKSYVVYKSGKGDANTDAAMESPFTPPANEFPVTGYDDEQQPKKGNGRFGGGFVPGLLTRAGRGEAKVVRVSSKGEVYIAGTDRSDGGSFPKPYIDRIDIRSGEKKRIFAGRGDLMETIDAVDGDDVAVVYTTRQKKDVVPDSYSNDLQSGKDEKLTNYRHAWQGSSPSPRT